MKPSHLTTPRTMSECHFDLESDPIERMNKRIMSIRFHVIILAVVAAVVAFDVFIGRPYA